MSEVFTGIIGWYDDGYWHSDLVSLFADENKYNAANGVHIIAGVLSVNEGTIAENVNATGITYTVEDSPGNIVQYSNYGLLQIYDYGIARNVTVSGSGWVATDGLVEHLYLDSGGSYTTWAGTNQLTNITNGGYIERLESGTLATGNVRGLNFIGNFYASAATLEDMTFNWHWEAAGSGGFAIAELYNGTYLKKGVVLGKSDSNQYFDYARVFLSSGASASGTLVNGGRMVISTGAQGQDIVVQSGGIVIVENSDASEQAIVSQTTISNGGLLSVTSLGFSDKADILAGGSQIVLMGGSALSATIHGGGVQLLSGTGAVASNTHVLSGGTECVYFFGESLSPTIERDGIQLVENGIVRNAQVHGTQLFEKYTYGETHDVTIHSGGLLEFQGKGSANGVQVNNGGTVRISDGTATVMNLVSGASLVVDSGGTVSGLTAALGAYVVAHGNGGYPGTLQDADFYNTLTLEEGGRAYDVRLHSGAVLEGKSSSYASNFTVHSGATANFSSGASMGKALVSGGIINMEGLNLWRLTLSDGIVNRNGLNDRYISGSGNTITSKGIYNVSSSNEFRLTVSDGGLAIVTDTTVSSGTVGSGGEMRCGPNTQLSSQTVSNGGVLTVAGAKATSRLTMENGSELHFCIAGYAADDFAVWFDGMSYFKGAASPCVTVDAVQMPGEYVLAASNADWISNMRIQNTDSVTLSIIDAGGASVQIGRNSYSLNLKANNALVLSVGLSAEPPTIVTATSSRIVWKSEDGKGRLSLGDGKGYCSLTVDGQCASLYGLPAQSFTVKVFNAKDDACSDVSTIRGEESSASPKILKVQKDGELDLMFGRASSQWNSHFMAKHVGVGKWTGTRQTVALEGKNVIADIYQGAEDASILLLTDDAQGDALFIEDIFSALPDGMEAQARIARIDEIRAGAGDDIVDLTSQRFEYVGGEMTVRGGLGDDVIWANKGDNLLFGDAGNDCIVGASGNDVLIGGSGNDSMHGGGGNDVFAFGGAWGNDTLEQLNEGSTLLWFNGIKRSALSLNADADGNAMLSCASGTVTLVGVNYDDISVAFASGGNELAEGLSLRFGDDGSEQYQNLLANGAFSEFTSERIFEQQNKGMLA